jgi:hypothetical protein
MALQKNVVDRIHQVTDAFTNWFIVEDGPGGALTSSTPAFRARGRRCTTRCAS